MRSPCPTGWKSEPEESVDLIRSAVGCGLFPLYEIYDGIKYRINEHPDDTPLEDYITHQRRYTKVPAEATALNKYIDAQWHYLDAMAKAPDGKGVLIRSSYNILLLSQMSQPPLFST